MAFDIAREPALSMPVPTIVIPPPPWAAESVDEEAEAIAEQHGDDG